MLRRPFLFHEAIRLLALGRFSRPSFAREFFLPSQHRDVAGFEIWVLGLAANRRSQIQGPERLSLPHRRLHGDANVIDVTSSDCGEQVVEIFFRAVPRDVELLRQFGFTGEEVNLHMPMVCSLDVERL